jgi:hypothetical protein
MAKAGVIKNPFRTTLNKGSLMSGDVVASATQYVELGRFTVQAGVALAVGFGAMEGQDSAAGRVYIDLKDTTAAPGAAVNGQLRIDIHNAQDRVQSTIWEARTESVRSSASDRTQQLPMPWINAVATEDVAFVFKFKSDTAVTVSKTNSTILMDGTSYEAE